jgi:hypothetical protein
MMKRRTTWPPVSASAPAWGVARSCRASPRGGRHCQPPELGRRGPGPRHGGDPRDHLTPQPEELRWLRRARSWRLLPRGRRSCRRRMGVTLKSSRPRPGTLLPGRPKQGWRRRCRRSGPRRLFREPGSKKAPPGAVDHGPKWVSISECLRLGFPFICLGCDFPFLLFLSSKRSHGQTDLAPRKALKTAPDCAVSAAPGLVVQPTLSQGVPPQGARASPVSGERAPEAGSSAEAAIVIGEAADADHVGHASARRYRSRRRPSRRVTDCCQRRDG